MLLMDSLIKSTFKFKNMVEDDIKCMHQMVVKVSPLCVIKHISEILYNSGGEETIKSINDSLPRDKLREKIMNETLQSYKEIPEKIIAQIKYLLDWDNYEEGQPFEDAGGGEIIHKFMEKNDITKYISAIIKKFMYEDKIDCGNYLSHIDLFIDELKYLIRDII
jgi:hypothetical protein